MSFIYLLAVEGTTRSIAPVRATFIDKQQAALKIKIVSCDVMYCMFRASIEYPVQQDLSDNPNPGIDNAHSK